MSVSSLTPPSDVVRPPDSASLRRYLLGLLADGERAAVERRYFEDDELFGALLAAEDDLIADYLGDRLLEDERVRFQASYLATSAGRERVRMAQALADARALPAAPARAMPAASRRWWPPTRGDQWLAAAATLLLVLGGAWSWREVVRLRTGVDDLTAAQQALRRDLDAANEETARQRARAGQAAEALARLQSSASPAGAAGPPVRVVALSLVPVAVRGGAPTDRVTIAAGTTVLELELAVDSRAPLNGVRVSLDADGRARWQVEVPAAVQSPAVLRVPIPASVLVPGAVHTATLERVASGQPSAIVHRYSFRVAAR
jgi:outer membrane murein-binding lipoprotein Lpp